MSVDQSIIDAVNAMIASEQTSVATRLSDPLEDAALDLWGRLVALGMTEANAKTATASILTTLAAGVTAGHKTAALAAYVVDNWDTNVDTAVSDYVLTLLPGYIERASGSSKIDITVDLPGE